MKKTSVTLALAICSLYFSSAFGSASQPQWRKECMSKFLRSSTPIGTATMYGIGSSAVISLIIGYENAEVICSFSGDCTGIRFGTDVIPPGTVSLIETSGRISGFRYSGFKFSCKE